MRLNRCKLTNRSSFPTAALRILGWLVGVVVPIRMDSRVVGVVEGFRGREYRHQRCQGSARAAGQGDRITKLLILVPQGYQCRPSLAFLHAGLYS